LEQKVSEGGTVTEVP